MGAQVSIKRLNAWQIKLILVFLMVLNHLEFVYGLCSDEMINVFIIVSRGVAPMFAYLAIEGIRHTRDIKKYCMRLWIWSGIVFAGNKLLEQFLLSNAANIAAENQVYLMIRTNICFTIAAGVSFIALFEYGKKSEGVKRYLFWALSILSFGFGFMKEWGVVLMFFILVTYFARESKEYKLLGYLVVEIIAVLFRSEVYYFLVFPLIALYNGKRGPNKKINKYFFYVFYPAHLWLIALVNYFLLTAK